MRATTRSHAWDPSDFAGDPDATTALNWLMRHYLSQLVGRYEQWLDVEDTWPAAWRDACGLSDDVVVVTADQLDALNREILAVVERFRDAGTDDPGARPVAVHHTAYPRDLRPPP